MGPRSDAADLQDQRKLFHPVVAGRKHTEKEADGRRCLQRRIPLFPLRPYRLLPTLRKGKEKRTRLLFILGCLWAAAVAVSRIWMGAHFLTDVTMAWLIALGMCALCVHLFYFDKRFFAKLWRVLSTSANPFLPKKRSVESPDSEPEN